MSKETMITDDGGLEILIKSKDVTWWDILWTSRETNSKHGGWNYQKYWTKRGIEKFLSNTPTNVPPSEIWTRNSKCNPPLEGRENNFMMKREDSDERMDLLSMSLNKQLECENALNYCLYKHFLGGTMLSRLISYSYEVPLCKYSDGQLKIDLLAFSKTGQTYIYELKQAKGKDSPLMALVELICYAIQLRRCERNIRKEVAVLKDVRFNKLNLTIAAPQGYWENWIRPAAEYDVHTKLTEICQKVAAGLEPDCKLVLVFAEVVRAGDDTKLLDKLTGKSLEVV